MSKTSNKKLLNNGVKKSRTVKVSRPTGVPWVISASSVVILVLLVGRGKKRILRQLYCYLQAKEGPNIAYREKMDQYWKDYDCLSWSNNTWHAKLRVI